MGLKYFFRRLGSAIGNAKLNLLVLASSAHRGLHKARPATPAELRRYRGAAEQHRILTGHCQEPGPSCLVWMVHWGVYTGPVCLTVRQDILFCCDPLYILPLQTKTNRNHFQLDLTCIQKNSMPLDSVCLHPTPLLCCEKSFQILQSNIQCRESSSKAIVIQGYFRW